MAFNIFATATSDIPLANLDANFTLIGAAAAASTLYPTATTSITYGTAGTTHNFSGSGLAVTGTLSATKASTGDVITFGSSGGNTGYLGSTASLISLLYGASGSGAGFYATSSVAAIISADQSKSAVISNTGLAVTGLISSTGTNGILRLLDGNTAGGVKIGAYNAAFTANGYLAFEGYSSEYGRFDSSGNLGIGITSPSQKLTVNAIATISDPASSTSQLTFGDAASDFAGRIFYSHSADAMQFFVNAAEAARIDSSGYFCINSRTPAANAKNSQLIVKSNDISATAYGITIVNNANSTSGRFINFVNYNDASAGSISQPTATTVLFNTTSDYRLKTVIRAVTGAGERIDALKPIDYHWIDGGEQARGFLAHEFQEVYANSVTGEKDAVDDNGKPIHQAMQASTPEVIADLVAELQSLRKRITALENK